MPSTGTAVIDNTIQAGTTLAEHKQQNAGKQTKYFDAHFHGPQIQYQENEYAKVASNYDNNTTVLELMGHLEREKRQTRNCFRRRCRQVSLNRKMLSIKLSGKLNFLLLVNELLYIFSFQTTEARDITYAQAQRRVANEEFLEAADIDGILRR